MKIHEYQAKNLLKNNNIYIPEGYIVKSLDESRNILMKIGYPCVIKAQVHAGGRGKAGGIKFAKNEMDAQNFIKNMLHNNLVTIQSGEPGQPINSFLIEKPCHIDKELYLAITIDRACDKICIIASSEGGMDIEVIAKKTPEKIVKQWVDILVGLKDYHIRNLHNQLDLNKNIYKQFLLCIQGLYNTFTHNYISLLEINPLAITGLQEKNLTALDAKIIFDDNALYKLPHIVLLKDIKQENNREILAQKYNLNYIALDGNIGCLVNGAGLAMGTMDIIKYVGGEPANFLDVGGSATQNNVKEALKLILRDSKVKAILINVFGGIARCDIIAMGIIDAAKEINISLPLIVRLEGTKAKEGVSILNKSNLNIISAGDLLEAASKAVLSIKHI